MKYALTHFHTCIHGEKKYTAITAIDVIAPNMLIVLLTPLLRLLPMMLPLAAVAAVAATADRTNTPFL